MSPIRSPKRRGISRSPRPNPFPSNIEVVGAAGDKDQIVSAFMTVIDPSVPTSMANLESVHVVNVPNKVERLCSSLDSCPVLHHKLHADKYVVRRNKKSLRRLPIGRRVSWT